MSDDFAALERAISGFPRETASLLAGLPKQRGVLNAEQVGWLGRQLGADIPQVMLRLLPVAAGFGWVPVSSFPVGVVAAGLPTSMGSALYFGANFEAAHAALNLTVHAEQAAAVNAWSNGEKGLSMLAASAAPCGYCRQFLCELPQTPPLRIIRPAGEPPGYSSVPLTDLLPNAFLPAELGNTHPFMTSASNEVRLELADSGSGPLIDAALLAAQQSYAPYSSAFAGCVVALTDGVTFTGRSIENVAFNPSLSAVQAAFVMMNLSEYRGRFDAVTRVVLVEHATKASQRALTENYVSVLAPHASLQVLPFNPESGQTPISDATSVESEPPRGSTLP
jgi:cytidine deaminase